MKLEDAKIYKLTSAQTDKVYIGSTCRKLRERLAEHRYRYYNPNAKVTTSGELLKYPDCKIELVELFPCESLKDLRDRERYHIERSNSVNYNKPARDPNQWYQDNKEKVNASHRKYYEQNKEKLKQTRKAYAERNREKGREYQQKYREKRKNLRVTCECGLEMQKATLPKHLKTQRHKNFLTRV